MEEIRKKVKEGAYKGYTMMKGWVDLTVDIFDKITPSFVKESASDDGRKEEE